MAKKINPPTSEAQISECLEVGRGAVKDNALKMIVTSKLYKTRVEKAKKGKGSFTRKAKHQGKEPYSKAA